ncbi:MAG: sensor histidine kinase [Balneolaceae bacterium]|nr:MAG: sensor histidine kinase [Balneolaceae bacterium]
MLHRGVETFNRVCANTIQFQLANSICRNYETIKLAGIKTVESIKKSHYPLNLAVIDWDKEPCLSITNDIVKAHGGELYLSSNPQIGTKFRIAFPRKQ